MVGAWPPCWLCARFQPPLPQEYPALLQCIQVHPYVFNGHGIVDGSTRSPTHCDAPADSSRARAAHVSSLNCRLPRCTACHTSRASARAAAEGSTHLCCEQHEQHYSHIHSILRPMPANAPSLNSNDFIMQMQSILRQGRRLMVPHSWREKLCSVCLVTQGSICETESHNPAGSHRRAVAGNNSDRRRLDSELGGVGDHHGTERRIG